MIRCFRCKRRIHEDAVHCVKCRRIVTEGVAMSWEEIGERLYQQTGERVTRQRLQQIADRAVRKARAALAEDPVIREWLNERGIPIPEPEDPSPEAVDWRPNE